MNTEVKKRGVALIWTLVTIAILLVVTSTMANYIIRESQMSVRIEDSTQSYALAQSGIEWAKDYISKGGPQLVDTEKEFFGAGNGLVIINTAVDPVTHENIVTSEGIYAGVRRKLQYVLRSNPSKGIDNSIISASTNQTRTDKSYDYQFNIWKVNNVPVQFGLSNKNTPGVAYPVVPAADLKTLGVKYDGNTNFTIFAWDGAAPVIEATWPISGTAPAGVTYAEPADPYAFKVKVRYLESTAAQMTVYRRDKDTGIFYCNGTATIDLSGHDFSMTTTAYFVSSVQPLTVVDDVLSYGGNGFIDNVFVHGIGL